MNPSSLPLPIRRQAAARAAVARFNGASLKYGTNDCIRMAGLTLRKMGHKVDLPKAGEYRTLRAGLKLLKARGHGSIEAALDGMGLPRVTLAFAQAADIIGVPGVDGLIALWVAVGNGRALGWHASSDQACIIQPTTDEAIVWSAAHG
jgi:hypothetical protein